MATPNIMTGDPINTLAGVQLENLIPGSLTVTGAVEAGSLTVNGVPVTGGSLLTTKGDLVAYSTLEVRLPVGDDGYALIADSGEVTGLNWVPFPLGGSDKEVQVNVTGATGAFDNFTYDNNLDGNGPGLTIGKTAQASNNVSFNMIDNSNPVNHTWDGTAYNLSIPAGNATGNITLQAAQSVGFSTPDGTLTLAVNGVDISGVGLRLTTAGTGFRVTEGSNCKQGTATLIAGEKVVSNTSVTANSRILITSQDDNGGNPGWLRISARTASTSFTITSSNGADTSIVAYQIFEPA